MGLVNKLKNILFEEEEVEIPVIEKKEKNNPPKNVERAERRDIEYKELPKKEVEKEPRYDNYDNFYDSLEPVIKEERRMEERNTKYQEVSEREIFKSEKTFNFPAFDEEEFQNIVPRTRVTSTVEPPKERDPRVVKDKKVEYKKPERKEEPAPPKNKFKPSPIISPVYGILDKNYTPDEIKTRETPEHNRLDVDSVRKKAFGTLDDKKKKEEKEKENLDSKILEEKLEKARTIDELLKDSSDEVIELNSNPQEEVNITYDDDIESIEDLEGITDKRKKEYAEETLENDLFDLIDSMYENREDGE